MAWPKKKKKSNIFVWMGIEVAAENSYLAKLFVLCDYFLLIGVMAGRHSSAANCHRLFQRVYMPGTALTELHICEVRGTL